MSTLQRTVLREMRPRLVDNVRAQDVIDYLIADNCLNMDDQEAIISIPYGKDRDKTRKLLDILENKDVKAFRVFLKALQVTGSGFVAEYLSAKFKDVGRREQDQIREHPPTKIPVQCSRDEIDAVPQLPVDSSSDAASLTTVPQRQVDPSPDAGDYWLCTYRESGRGK